MIDHDIFRQITCWLLSRTKESNNWHMKFVLRFRWPHSRGCCCEGARIVHFRCDRCLSSFCTKVSIKINFIGKSFSSCSVMAAAAFHLNLWIVIIIIVIGTIYLTWSCKVAILKIQCAVPENIRTPPTEGIGISSGVGGSVRPKNLKKCMRLNWNFQGGGGA